MTPVGALEAVIQLLCLNPVKKSSFSYLYDHKTAVQTSRADIYKLETLIHIHHLDITPAM